MWKFGSAELSDFSHQPAFDFTSFAQTPLS